MTNSEEVKDDKVFILSVHKLVVADYSRKEIDYRHCYEDYTDGFSNSF